MLAGVVEKRNAELGEGDSECKGRKGTAGWPCDDKREDSLELNGKLVPGRKKREHKGHSTGTFLLPGRGHEKARGRQWRRQEWRETVDGRTVTESS